MIKKIAGLIFGSLEQEAPARAKRQTAKNGTCPRFNRNMDRSSESLLKVRRMETEPR